MWPDRDSNPGSLAYRASTLPLTTRLTSYNYGGQCSGASRVSERPLVRVPVRPHSFSATVHLYDSRAFINYMGVTVASV